MQRESAAPWGTRARTRLQSASESKPQFARFLLLCSTAISEPEPGFNPRPEAPAFLGAIRACPPACLRLPATTIRSSRFLPCTGPVGACPEGCQAPPCDPVSHADPASRRHSRIHPRAAGPALDRAGSLCDCVYDRPVSQWQYSKTREAGTDLLPGTSESARSHGQAGGRCQQTERPTPLARQQRRGRTVRRT